MGYEGETAEIKAWHERSRLSDRLPAISVSAMRKMRGAHDRVAKAESAGRNGRPLQCPGKGQGGCSRGYAHAEPVHTYIKALVIAEQQKIEFRKLGEIQRGRKHKS